MAFLTHMLSLGKLLCVALLPAVAVAAAAAPAAPAFRNQGTPPNVSASFDCESRRHAYEFAKTTLPHRGEFRTVFDALQLQACGLTPPSEMDDFVAPRFPTPSSGTVLYVAANATAAEGDGSKAKPFALPQALAAAAAVTTGPVTLLLRGGTYRLMESLHVRPEHSNDHLTIQNYDGEEAILSGAAAVAVTKSAWSLVNASTNTWRLDISKQAADLFPNYGLRVGTKRAILAKYPNGDPELSAVHMDSGSIPYGPGTYLPGSGRSEQIPTYFSREHAPVNETVEYWARPGDWPGVVWHEFKSSSQPMDGAGGYGAWFHAQGGAKTHNELAYFCNFGSYENSIIACQDRLRTNRKKESSHKKTRGCRFCGGGGSGMYGTGLCSGRQVDHGYWCSANAPRSGADNALS
jgi:hypothetical protein